MLLGVCQCILVTSSAAELPSSRSRSPRRPCAGAYLRYSGATRGARHSGTRPPGAGADRGAGAQPPGHLDAGRQRPDGRPHGASPPDRRHAAADRYRRRPDHHAARVDGRGDRGRAGAGRRHRRVRGRVFNTATGEYVRNAEVRVEGTTIAALSEDGGDFRLTGVPAGEVTVVVDIPASRRPVPSPMSRRPGRHARCPAAAILRHRQRADAELVVTAIR